VVIGRMGRRIRAIACYIKNVGGNKNVPKMSFGTFLFCT